MPSTEPPGTLAAAAPPPVPVRVADGERTGSVALRGMSLTVRSRPAGRQGLQPALFVHGLGGSSQNWTPLMAELGSTVDCEAIDLPGFGDSPPPDDGDYSITGHARAVVRFLDFRSRGPVHLFGNSLGGAVVTRVAAVRPDLVRTLTLVSPALPEVRVQRDAIPTALMALPGVPALFLRLSRDWTAEQRVRGVMALCYGDPNRVVPEDLQNAVEEMERRMALPYFWDALTNSARGVVSAYTTTGRHNLWQQAKRVTVPTLLVYGGRDRLVSYRMARRALGAFPDSRLVSLPGAGHVAMMEYPRTVGAAFRELLGETGRSGQDLEAGERRTRSAEAGPDVDRAEARRGDGGPKDGSADIGAANPGTRSTGTTGDTHETTNAAHGAEAAASTDTADTGS